MPRDRIRAEIREIAADGSFSFACHPQVPCFTGCCRDLELALSPYDLFRLLAGLGMGRGEFVERHVMFARIPEEPLPQALLLMNEADGRCPFVSDSGCRVYADRPAACRAYPLARGTAAAPGGGRSERFAVIREPHCLGFADPGARAFTPASWLADQGLAPYNRAADLLGRLRDLALEKGGPAGREAELYITLLYLEPLAADEEKNRGGEETLELLKNRIDEVARRIFA